FYLRNFQISNRPGIVYSYIRNFNPKPMAISRIACEKDYYQLRAPSLPIPPDSIDKMLQQAETDAARIISKLISANKLDLSKLEFDQLSGFIGLLAQRTPFAREGLVNILTALTERDHKKFAENEELFMQMAKEALPDD